MDSITVFKAEERNGSRPAHGMLARAAISFLVFIVAFTAAPLGAAGNARQARPGGGSDPQLIRPESLGAPEECAGSSFGTGFNDGSFPAALSVSSETYGCASQYNRPYIWRGGVWLDLGSLPESAGGITQAVSEHGTAVGMMAGIAAGAFVKDPGAAMESLPLLPGMTWSAAYGIGPTGNHIVGDNQSEWESRAVLWMRGETGWEARDLGPGSAEAVSEWPLVVIGNSWADGGWVWSGGASRIELGAEYEVRDISPDGAVIVGLRWQACADPCGFYPVPVYWRMGPQGWEARDLAALDGVDSRALGVGIVGQRAVIVGQGFTRADAVQRAVVWLPAADGSYGPPLRLGSLTGNERHWTTAIDVNAHGLVLGTSKIKGFRFLAVVWQLPEF